MIYTYIFRFALNTTEQSVIKSKISEWILIEVYVLMIMETWPIYLHLNIPLPKICLVMAILSFRIISFKHFQVHTLHNFSSNFKSRIPIFCRFFLWWCFSFICKCMMVLCVRFVINSIKFNFFKCSLKYKYFKKFSCAQFCSFLSFFTIFSLIHLTVPGFYIHHAHSTSLQLLLFCVLHVEQNKAQKKGKNDKSLKRYYKVKFPYIFIYVM